MFIDAQNLLADAQALTATAVGSNVIDLSTDRSIGNGEPMCVLFTVDVAADQGTGDEDYTFDVEYAGNAAQSSGRELVGRRIFESGTPTAPAQDADLLVAGFQFVIPIPPTSLAESDQYLGIRSTLAGTSPSVTITAAVMPMCMIDSNQVSYPDGFTVS